jgi:hypothetical protein
LEKKLRRDAGAIPGVDRAAALRLVILDSSLGGSAPRLRYFGYISPEANRRGERQLASSVLSSLETLSLQFQSESPQSRPDWESRCPPPSKHSVIHALDYFRFKRVVEYLADLVTCIDAPPTEELSSMKILTAHDSPNSSIVYQYSRHAMKHVWNLMIPPPTSDFNTRHWHLGLMTTNIDKYLMQRTRLAAFVRRPGL